MSSFSISLSGLLADEEDLNVISNNLANLNTVGYKGESVQFQDLFYQEMGTNGTGDPIQVGVGTGVGSTSADFTQGTIESTGLDTDLAIQGDGFLQVTQGDMTLYTRNGDLSINSQGYLVTSDGSEVMGYAAVNGVVSATGALGPLQINNGQTSPPQATSNMTLAANLDAGANVGDTYTSSMVVYDSLGTSHVLTFNFAKTGANSWSYQITIPAADVGQTGSDVTLNSGTLAFDGNGNLLTPAKDVSGITVTGLADGASNLSLTWNLYGSNGSSEVTQLAGQSATTSNQQNGYAAGSLTGFTIGTDGTIVGQFTNGQPMSLGMIALAIFPNSQGLLRTGSNNFMASLASGLPTVGAPGTGGRGTIADASLESSNVDIATQFAQLILAERAYQANTQAITTADNLLQDAINLIH